MNFLKYKSLSYKKLLLLILIAISLLEFSCAPKYNPEYGPQSYFKCNKQRAYPETEITLENLSKGTDFYIWDFGDGRISMEQNPIIKYSEPGTYKVNLFVKNGPKSNSYSREINIVQKPKSCTITGIKIQRMPFFDASSNPWDGALQGVYPDVYIKVYGFNNNLLYSTPVNQRKENLGPNSLPTTFQFDRSQNLIFTDFNQPLSIVLYDFDSFSSDQIISITRPLFSINYYYENAVNPEEILLTGKNTLINLNLSWQY